MGLALLSADPLVRTRKLMFIGFSGQDASFHPALDESEHEFETEQLGQIYHAFEWLANRSFEPDVAAKPFAVFVAYSQLATNNFLQIAALCKHPLLSGVPLIALAAVGTRIDKKMLLQLGLDDCYTAPFSWEQIMERVDFLHQYKSAFKQTPAQNSGEQFRVPISTGKRIFDIVGAIIALVLLSPVYLLTAIAIMLESSGPVIYRSQRVGAGFQVFPFYKFRSMYKGAEEQLEGVIHFNQYDAKDLFIKIPRDPRVTRVGRIIRKFSIDELPQLINVLKGDMSLVGNRPLPMYEAEQLTRDEWSARFLAPAGISGLWQVTRRGFAEMSVEERIQLDIEYARTASFATDLRILIKTLTAFIQKEDV